MDDFQGFIDDLNERINTLIHLRDQLNFVQEAVELLSPEIVKLLHETVKQKYVDTVTALDSLGRGIVTLKDAQVEEPVQEVEAVLKR